MGSNALTRLLVGSAGGVVSEHAAELARGIAVRAGAKLEVLAVETAGLPALAAVGEHTQRNGSSPAATWVRGVPGVEIVHRAQALAVDLIVLGRRESATGGVLPLGRTADTVIRRHDGPCLLVPPSVQRLDRMLLALDGTQRGLGILEPAAVLAAVLGAECQSAHVSGSDSGSGLTTESGWTDPGAQRVRRALAEFPVLGGESALRLRAGAPVGELLATLEEFAANLLVLGVRRGGPPGEMGSGHVGRDLLRSAPVAILTVPI